jgi:hypothetical protein
LAARIIHFLIRQGKNIALQDSRITHHDDISAFHGCGAPDIFAKTRNKPVKDVPVVIDERFPASKKYMCVGP